METEFRHITEGDIDKCIHLFTHFYKQYPWNNQWQPERVIKHLKEYLVNPLFKGFVIVDKGKIVAAIFGHIKTWCISDQLVIDEFLIDLSVGSHGGIYGKNLLKYCEKYCKENGLEMMYMIVNRHESIHDFYIHNEFTKVNHYSFVFKQIEQYPGF